MAFRWSRPGRGKPCLPESKLSLADVQINKVVAPSDYHMARWPLDFQGLVDPSSTYTVAVLYVGVSKA